MIDNSTLRGNLPVSNFLAISVGNLRTFRFFQLGLIFSAQKTIFSKIRRKKIVNRKKPSLHSCTCPCFQSLDELAIKVLLVV